MKIIYDSITQAVTEHEQNDLLAQALSAWFSELANGNESISDNEAVKRRLDLLLEKTIVNLEPVITTDDAANE